MKGTGKFISAILIIDTFFVSYAVGFNSRHVPVVDAKLPPLVQPKAEPAAAKEPANKARVETAAKEQGKGKKSAKEKKASGPAAAGPDSHSRHKKHAQAKAKAAD